MGATIAGNIGLEYALVTPLCYRDNCDVSVTFQSRLSCTKEEFLKQFKLTFVEMNTMRREIKKSTGNTSCKTQVIN